MIPISKSIDLALLLIRVIFGSFMIYGHGWRKLLRLFGDEPIQFADPFGLGPVPSLALAVFAEVLCAFLIIIGLGTRFATIPLIITMLVAAFIANAGQPFGEKELALVYLFAFAALAIAGPGWYSVDAQLVKKKV
ncbi:MAG: DoxX family protein [Saprospiraceae bacterium]